MLIKWISVVLRIVHLFFVVGGAVFVLFCFVLAEIPSDLVLGGPEITFLKIWI